MKDKKEYRKPQVTQVRLAVKNPILANCNTGGVGDSAPASCNFSNADCAQPI